MPVEVQLLESELLRVALQFVPNDLWVGLYWKRTPEAAGSIFTWEIWFTVVPMLPLYFTWSRDAPWWREEQRRMQEERNE